MNSKIVNSFKRQLNKMSSQAEEIQGVVDSFKNAIPQMLEMLDRIERGIKLFSGTEEKEITEKIIRQRKTDIVIKPETTPSSDIMKNTIGEIFSQTPVMKMEQVYNEFHKRNLIPKSEDLGKKTKDRIRFTMFNLEREKKIIKRVEIPGKKRSGIWAKIDYDITGIEKHIKN